MEAPTSNISVKTIEIENEGKKLILQIQIIKNNLCVLLYKDNTIIYEGFISLPKIQCQIGAFNDYNINGIFEEINILKDDDFILIKEKDKYLLTIKFIILRRKKNLYINLKHKDNILNDDLINEITQLKEILKIKTEKINYLKKYVKKINKLTEKDEDTNCKEMIGNLYMNYYINKYSNDITSWLMEYIQKNIFNKNIKQLILLLEDDNILSNFLQIKKNNYITSNQIKEIITKYLDVLLEVINLEENKGKKDDIYSLKFFYNYNVPVFYNFIKLFLII